MTATSSSLQDVSINGNIRQQEIPSWEETYNAIVVNIADPRVIAEATLYLILNPETAANIGRNGRKSVLEQYSIDRQMAQYEALYEAIHHSARS